MLRILSITLFVLNVLFVGMASAAGPMYCQTYVEQIGEDGSIVGSTGFHQIPVKVISESRAIAEETVKGIEYTGIFQRGAPLFVTVKEKKSGYGATGVADSGQRSLIAGLTYPAKGETPEGQKYISEIAYLHCFID